MPFRRLNITAAGQMLALVAGSLLAPAVFAQDDPSTHRSRVEERLRADVAYLADDLRGGRGTGTRGIDDAADYIALVFREAGLKFAPGADGYFQPFTVRGEVRPSASSLALALPGGKVINGENAVDYAPLAIGSEGTTTDAPVVFAGYGISADDERLKLKYDDYAGLDVKGKVVLIIRREPTPADKNSPFAGENTTQYATFQHKVVNALEHGAKAVLMVNDGPSTQNKDELLDFQATPRGGSIPFLMITRALGNQILKSAHQPTLDELEANINQTLQPQSRDLTGVSATLKVEQTRDSIVARNVIGVLEGEGPHADETIIVGAHYDHLGKGGVGSLAFGSRDIHNGADDNASGTATVLELARTLAARPDPLPRRVVFMLFSGEELGLLGSAHYANEKPLYPLDKTVAMLNFDMVGRYEQEKGLTVYGAMSSEGFGPLVESLAKSQGFRTKMPKPINDGFSDSDHSSFYRKNIPILFFFTGTHADYHRPSDDTEKINFDGMERVVNLGELIVLDIARRPSRPLFQKNAPTTTVAADPHAAAPADPHAATPADPHAAAGAATETSALRGNGAYLGSRPAYGEDIVGVKLDGVTEGSPADKAGLKAGDVIIKFANLPVKDIESYTVALGSKKPGDEVEIVVQRDGKEVTLKATLSERKSATPRD